MQKFFPTTDDIKLLVARGLVAKTSHNHKFGAVKSMSTNTTGTLWDVNDTIYPWAAWNTPGTVAVSAVHANDNGKSITIQGLDSNFDFQEETIVVSSAGSVAGTKTFARLNRGFVSVGDTNYNTIVVKKGSTTVLSITAGMGQTLMCVYTVPAGKTAYLYQGTCSAESGADASGFMMVRYPDTGTLPFRVGHTFEVSGNAPYNYKFEFPSALPAKSDIDVRVTTRSNNGRYTASFDLLLIDDV